MVAVRWYLRFGLSYRDVEELLAERGVEVDHVSVFRWVHRFTPLLGEPGGRRSPVHAAGKHPSRPVVPGIAGRDHGPGDRVKCPVPVEVRTSYVVRGRPISTTGVTRLVCPLWSSLLIDADA